MSLINDALKKAQRQREGSSTDPAGSLIPQIPQAASAAPSSTGKNNTALIIAGAAAVVALSVAATVYILRNGQRETAPPTVANGPANLLASPAGSAAAVAPPPVSPATTPAPAATTPVGSSNGSTNTAVAPSPADAPQPASATQSAPAGSIAATGLPEPAPRVSSPEADRLKVTNRIQGLIDKFKISGIRLADADSKVLLNDHLFRINDLVEPSLGLRLTKIESHELTFTDADGNSYLKHF